MKKKMTEQGVLSEATKTVDETVSGLGVLDITREDKKIILDDCRRIYLQAANIIQIMLDMDNKVPEGVTKH